MERIRSIVGRSGFPVVLVMIMPHVFAISMDGDFSDWRDVPPISRGALAAIAPGMVHDSRIRSVCMASDADFFYLAVECSRPIHGERWSPPNVLLDTDLNKKTGFLSGPLGAEYFVAPPRDATGLLVTDGRLAVYSRAPDANNGSWGAFDREWREPISALEKAYMVGRGTDSNRVEIRIPWQVIGIPEPETALLRFRVNDGSPFCAVKQGSWAPAARHAYFSFGDDPLKIDADAPPVPLPPVRIVVDVRDTGTTISPMLFGHNLEHTRKAIWKGISAEMVANRKFAAQEDGLPMHWVAVGEGRAALDDKDAYAGKNSVVLGDRAGIAQQQDWLAFREGTEYAFRLWAKADTPHRLRLRIVDASRSKGLFETEMTCEPGDWRLLSGHFIAHSTELNAWFEIANMSEGIVRIGVVSLMPADNFHGMRRDVVEMLKTFKGGSLRWPGGCFAEQYPWKDGLLPVDKRPPLGPGYWIGLLPDSDHYDNHEIGTDEFMALCRELNTEPAITIRYGGDAARYGSAGSPEEAADWVQYCNGAVGTTWGALRAERGNPKPYGVKYWYLGNEMWGVCMVPGATGKGCADMSASYAKAMHKADPATQLIAATPTFNDDTNREWLAPLLAQANAELSLTQAGLYCFAPDEPQSMERIVGAVNGVARPMIRGLRSFLDRTPPDGKRLGIVFYEWNAMWGQAGDVLSGVFAADMLNMFCCEAEALKLVQTGFFQPVSEGGIKVEPLTCTLDATGEVFVLYAEHHGNRLIKTAEDEDISLCASLAPDGGSMCVTLLNRDTTAERRVTLNLRNCVSRGEAEARSLIPENLNPGAMFRQVDSKVAVAADGAFTVTLPPCAILRLRLGLK